MTNRISDAQGSGSGRISRYGLGLRSPHYAHVLENFPPVDWFEVISENFMVEGGKPRRILRQIRENYPVMLHGVSLSLGSTDPLNPDYLNRLKALIAEIEPSWISDHLCWGSKNRHYAHDLLPLPYTQETLNHLADRIGFVQDFLKRAILIENVSSYVHFKNSEMTEWDFLAQLTRQTGCHLLLDINNIYVSSRNHGYKPEIYVQGIPRGTVKQFHLAGHSDYGTHVIDTHDHPVRREVWNLYELACRRFAPVATMIERDDHIPEFDELWSELAEAKRIQEKVLTENDKNKLRDSPRPILESHHRPL